VVLRGVLDLRISIADEAAVAEVLSSAGESVYEAGENLVAALRPEAVELELPTAYLQEITEAVDTAEPEPFLSARDHVFTELGIALPPFRFAPADHLKPRTFTCKVNHLSTAPILGLAPGERLPVEGLETQGPLEYLALGLEAAVRAHAACLIHRRAVQAQLDLLGQAFPALVDVVRMLVPIERITGALRALASDGTSTRNLRYILERLLDWEDPPVGSSPWSSSQGSVTARGPTVAWDESLTDLIAFLRAGLPSGMSTVT
jgi:flagellar biosynthesis component FlhA